MKREQGIEEMSRKKQRTTHHIKGCKRDDEIESSIEELKNEEFIRKSTS